MYVLRARALETERGDSPDLSAIYAPGALKAARRRLIAVWVLCASWLLGLIGPLLAVLTVATSILGTVLAVSTQFEAAWIGSPIRRWSLLGIPVAVLGIGVILLLMAT